MAQSVRSAAVVAAIVTFSAPVSHAAPRLPITLYEHKDYGGRFVTITSPAPNLSGSGLNDRVSSLKVVPGQRWLLCKSKKYRGGCIIVDRDVPDLDALNFNDAISSLKPVE